MLTPSTLALLRSLPLGVRRRLAACEGPGWLIDADGHGPLWLQVGDLWAVPYQGGGIVVPLIGGPAVAYLPASEDAILGVVVALLTERGWESVEVEIHRDAEGAHVCASGWPASKDIPEDVRAGGPDLRSAALALLARVAGEVERG